MSAVPSPPDAIPAARRPQAVPPPAAPLVSAEPAATAPDEATATVPPEAERRHRRRFVRATAMLGTVSSLLLSSIHTNTTDVVQPTQWPSAARRRAQPTEVAERRTYGVPFPAVTTQAGGSHTSWTWHWFGLLGNGLAGAGLVIGVVAARRRRREGAV